jgi:hypothetical protein
MRNIKNIFKPALLSVLLIAATSCEDWLTIIPEDSQVLETYYTSDDAVNANTASLYAAVTWQDFDLNFMWMAGDELSGDLFYTYGEEGHFYYMTFQNGNSFLTQGWNGLYRVISYCNNIINGMPPAAKSNGISDVVINRALAEARCIRGISYYFLTEYWGDVPIITDNNMPGSEVVRHKQASVYEFIRRDLEFAKNNLPTTPFQAGRCTKWTAEGMLAKLHLTIGAFSNSQSDYDKAKEYAADVINNSGLSLYADLGKMFYPAGNNNPESLFAIQCTQDGYGYGNPRNVSLSRDALITLGSSWGAGKGPTLSLQEAFETGDARRKLTYMRNGDFYSNLGGGGYTYTNIYPVEEEKPTEEPNQVLAHVRKYVIGGNADCDGVSGGTNQDAGNNLYLLRLADVYLCYVEACIGSGTSTSDALALDVFARIRTRAGLAFSGTSITMPQLYKERRVEFAMESINFFDIKRMNYRNANDAITYLNDMHRERQYISNGEYTEAERNAANAYHGGFTSLLPADDPAEKGSIYYLSDTPPVITFTAENLILPVPAETMTKTPSMAAEPVDYEF